MQLTGACGKSAGHMSYLRGKKCFLSSSDHNMKNPSCTTYKHILSILTTCFQSINASYNGTNHVLSWKKHTIFPSGPNHAHAQRTRISLSHAEMFRRVQGVFCRKRLAAPRPQYIDVKEYWRWVALRGSGPWQVYQYWGSTNTNIYTTNLNDMALAGVWICVLDAIEPWIIYTDANTWFSVAWECVDIMTMLSSCSRCNKAM